MHDIGTGEIAEDFAVCPRCGDVAPFVADA
jgi:hypothetical protein